MNRRDTLAALVLMPIASVLAAEPRSRVPVVGLLITDPAADDLTVDVFRAGLRKYGYEDGQNIKLEVRTALGRLERVPGLAEQLVSLPVDVIVVVNEVALRASKQATRSIPIVMAGFTDDPLALGLIESYRRPGGNITGVFNVNAALGAKRLEILKETVPKLSRAAVLWDAFGKRQLDELQGAAPSMALRLDPIEIQDANDLERAFKAARARKDGAVIMTFSPVFWTHRTRIAAIALDQGLPTISDMQILGQTGCLLAYGSDMYYNWERAAYFVDRLLKGSSAAELPVEQISKLTLVVNLKTAKGLGINIPEPILLRADEVIR